MNTKHKIVTILTILLLMSQYLNQRASQSINERKDNIIDAQVKHNESLLERVSMEIEIRGIMEQVEYGKLKPDERGLVDVNDLMKLFYDKFNKYKEYLPELKEKKDIIIQSEEQSATFTVPFFNLIIDASKNSELFNNIQFFLIVAIFFVHFLNQKQLDLNPKK